MVLAMALDLTITTIAITLVQSQWLPTAPTPLVFTICTATFGNGRKIAGIKTMRALPSTVQLGYLATALGVFCAAALGAAIRTISAPLIAATVPLASVSISTVSASPELSIKSCIFTSLDSLPCAFAKLNAPQANIPLAGSRCFAPNENFFRFSVSRSSQKSGSA